MNKPVLYAFAGLPGSGKSTIASEFAKRTHAVYLRIDTIEQAMRDLCGVKVEGEGYGLAYQVAADNLRAGNSVIADSCNPVQLTRDWWRTVATETGAEFVNIEVVCADLEEHRRRVESREVDIEGLVLPTWQQVQEREYHPWTQPRIVADTARRSVADCVVALLAEPDLR